MSKNKYSSYTFHEEFHNTRKTRSQGNVLAVFGDWYRISVREDKLKECIGGIYSEPNSPVCGCSTSQGYLRTKCKKIDVKKAQKIHPNLFSYLTQL